MPEKYLSTSRFIPKQKICKILNIAPSTLRTLINSGPVFLQLQKLNYNKNQKNLTPCQANYIFEHFGIGETENII